jgi:hypothetical protein
MILNEHSFSKRPEGKKRPVAGCGFGHKVKFVGHKVKSVGHKVKSFDDKVNQARVERKMQIICA